MRPLTAWLIIAAMAIAASFGAQGAALSSGLAPAETRQAVESAAPIPRDLRSIAAAYRGIDNLPQVVNPTQPDYARGRVDSFWVSRTSPPEHFQVEAELRIVGRHAYWYVQRGFTVSDSALREAADAFDTRIYPEVRRLVGSELFPGIDNDPRITILNGDVPGVAGYETSSDSYSRLVHQYSNEREMVYVNLKAVVPGNSQYLATIAHEFTHLVHANVHRGEDTWVKEGLAEFVSAILADGRMPGAAFTASPDLQLTAWPPSDVAPGSVGARYQAASWFIRYFTEQYGRSALTEVLAGQKPGPRAFDAYLEREDASSFGSLLGDWAVANLVGTRTGVGGRPYTTTTPGTVRTRMLSSPQSVTDSVAQYGTNYYELLPQGRVEVQFDGQTTVAVLGTAPHDGDGMWYAGRADESVATMTGRFDLSSATSASLGYALWYDTEKDYDYVFVSVSTDGGARWEIIETPSMSRDNTTGNNLGVGYTGRSGSGPTPSWIQETTDLSDYVGALIWIRFTYLTDDAINGPGAVLDDIRLDALGFFDSAEQPSNTWDLNGWSRVGASLVQTWMVQAVEFVADGYRVSRIPVDSTGKGSWSSQDGVDRVVIIVSGTAPVTLERGDYVLDTRAL
ncbi:MAG: hypothetical protein HW416_1315 [Chloroflexi bacterium]|nr:hypothetical protein [Chloroflexota bacterium]